MSFNKTECVIRNNLIKKKKSNENAECEGNVFLENSHNCSGWEIIYSTEVFDKIYYC